MLIICGFPCAFILGNYFKWSSDVPTSPAPETTGKSEEDQIVGHKDTHNIFTPIQGELLKIFSEHKDGSFSLQHHFCDLVGRLLEQKQESSLPEANTDVSNPETKGKFDSLKSNEEQTNERDDGVLRSKIKFGKSKVSTRSKDMKTSTSVFTNSTSDTLLCSILDLLQLVVSGPQNKWSSDWFSVLCEIISTNTSNTLRGMAKKMLQRMCGGRRDVYHRVRDHYVFAFSYRKLLQQSKAVLDVALDVREQARQCGPKWRDDEVTFESISASGLLGVEDLISEDCYTVEREESISAVLEELLEATRARGQNWRQFCCLPEISAALSSGRVHAPGDGAARFDALEQIYHRSPIISLLWLGSCLRGANQIKVLTLIDIALADITAIVDTIQTDDVYLGISSGTDEDDYLNMGGYLSKACNQLSNPELCLVQCLTIQDLHAFITQFVLQGRTPELRSVASSVAYKLAGQFPQNEKNLLFGGLIDGPLRDVGQLGSASVDFFDFLQLFIECFGSELDLSSVATCLTMAFGLQMTTVFHYCRPKMNGVEKSETEQKELNFDLSNCVNCHKQQLPKKAPVTFKSPPQKSNSPNENPADCGAGFLPDQVRPYQKSRLEASTVSSVSSEFSSYTQLKCRVALSQVQVTVSDPRGRLVKTIGVYFTPRQVSDVNDLKSDKYLHLWQRCGILTLARGASEASFKLKNSVIAANLKFTYESFYEKLGGMRAPDGSLILHCPRCTRQVNNAHGKELLFDEHQAFAIFLISSHSASFCCRSVWKLWRSRLSMQKM